MTIPLRAVLLDLATSGFILFSVIMREKFYIHPSYMNFISVSSVFSYKANWGHYNIKDINRAYQYLNINIYIYVILKF